MDEQNKIADRCPSCGHQTLFIGSGGWLTCSWVQCKQPSLGEAFERYERIEQALAALVENANGYDKSWVDVAVCAIRRTDIYDRGFITGRLAEFAEAGRLALLDAPLTSGRR